MLSFKPAKGDPKKCQSILDQLNQCENKHGELSGECLAIFSLFRATCHTTQQVAKPVVPAPAITTPPQTLKK